MASVERLTGARWNNRTTWMFISFALGLALESYVFSLASIAVGWVAIPKSLGELMLAWAPIWLIIGIGVAGPFSDKFGRKMTLYLTLILYAVGGIVLFFATSYVLLLIALAAMLIAGGGEMNSIMVASHELMPRRHRGKATMLIINGINFGGMVLAIVALATAAVTGTAAIAVQRDAVAVAVLVVVAVLFATRVRMPESFLWLQKKGRTDEAEATVARYYGSDWKNEVDLNPAPPRHQTSGGYMFFTMVVVVLIAAANTIGFGLMAYALAFAFFPHLQPAILLVFEGAGFVVGFLALIADRVSRKKYLFWTFLGTFALTVAVALTTSAWQKDMTLFWVLLIVLAGFNSLCYLTSDVLKAEVWPTLQRGTLTAVARFVSIGLYIPSIYIVAHMATQQYVTFNAEVWGVGLLAAIAWLVWGRETGLGVSIQQASGEEVATPKGA